MHQQSIFAHLLHIHLCWTIFSEYEQESGGTKQLVVMGDTILPRHRHRIFAKLYNQMCKMKQACSIELLEENFM